MANNSNLANAKNKKNDEFYTQITDIEEELRHYKKHFKDKIILCNCDDPYESNFFKYFAINFNHLGLKKLIATCYDNSPVAYTQMNFFGENKSFANKNHHPYKIEITKVEDCNGDGAFDLSDVDYLLKNKSNTMTLLKENGDFRSDECIELLKQSDIVITNPPYSLINQFIPFLIKYNKKFIIMGPMNAVTYKEVFPLLMHNKIWAGYGFNKTMKFRVPDSYNGFFENGVKYGKVQAICWYTNLEIDKRNEKLILYKKYSPQEYPQYLNLEGIDVCKVSEIPYDYFGIMGVPKNFIEKYNPEQFEIVGYEREDENVKVGIQNMPVKFLEDYRKQGGKGHYTKGMKMICFYDKNGQAKIPFSRILIRRKTNEN